MRIHTHQRAFLVPRIRPTLMQGLESNEALKLTGLSISQRALFLRSNLFKDFSHKKRAAILQKVLDGSPPLEHKERLRLIRELLEPGSASMPEQEQLLLFVGQMLFGPSMDLKSKIAYFIENKDAAGVIQKWPCEQVYIGADQCVL